MIELLLWLQCKIGRNINNGLIFDWLLNRIYKNIKVINYMNSKLCFNKEKTSYL